MYKLSASDMEDICFALTKAPTHYCAHCGQRCPKGQLQDVWSRGKGFYGEPYSSRAPICNTCVDFLLEGMIVDVVSDASTETVLYADVPVKVQMKITYTEPGLKGDTATNTLKPATVESGATVRVPLFINEGETIEIDTRDGSYVGRVKA